MLTVRRKCFLVKNEIKTILPCTATKNKENKRKKPRKKDRSRKRKTYKQEETNWYN